MAQPNSKTGIPVNIGVHGRVDPYLSGPSVFLTPKDKQQLLDIPEDPNAISRGRPFPSFDPGAKGGYEYRIPEGVTPFGNAPTQERRDPNRWDGRGQASPLISEFPPLFIPPKEGRGLLNPLDREDSAPKKENAPAEKRNSAPTVTQNAAPVGRGGTPPRAAHSHKHVDRRKPRAQAVEPLVIPDGAQVVIPDSKGGFVGKNGKFYPSSTPHSDVTTATGITGTNGYIPSERTLRWNEQHGNADAVAHIRQEIARQNRGVQADPTTVINTPLRAPSMPTTGGARAQQPVMTPVQQPVRVPAAPAQQPVPIDQLPRRNGPADRNGQRPSVVEPAFLPEALER